MLDPNIPMAAAKPIDTATPIYNMQDQMNQNALSTEQVLKSHYEAMDAREKSRLQSVVIGATQLKSFLDNNDVDGAKDFLRRRKQTLSQRQAFGENIDTEDTDYALKALEEGKVSELYNEMSGVLAAGRVAGLTDTQNNNTYMQQFSAVKRANPHMSDSQVWDYVYTRGQVGKSTTYDANGNVVNQPGAVDANAAMKSSGKFAEEIGGSAGKAVIENDKTLGNLNNLQQSVNSAMTTLPKVRSTGPIFGRTGAAARDPEYVNLQRDLNEITLLAKDLYNLGSGQGFTDADREFLKELAGGSYNREESIDYSLRRFDEAIKNRSKYLQSQNQRYQKTYGQGQTAQPQQPAQPTVGGKRVRVVKGNEAYMIDPADLAAAIAEGFAQQ